MTDTLELVALGSALPVTVIIDEHGNWRRAESTSEPTGDGRYWYALDPGTLTTEEAETLVGAQCGDPVCLVQQAFPGAVDINDNPIERLIAAITPAVDYFTALDPVRIRKPGWVAIIEAIRLKDGPKLIEAVGALLDHMQENEPARYLKPDWQTVVAAHTRAADHRTTRLKSSS